MVGLLFVGFWLVLQPTLAAQASYTEGANAYTVRVGSTEMRVEQRGQPGAFEYRFVGDPTLEELGWVGSDAFERALAIRHEAWRDRPAFERGLLGFFNISSWGNFVWIVVGLGGQVCFFGRMLIQWVISENRRESVVPPMFWWLSFFGGVALFTYFVWRVDFVGVLGQSTGVVVYARNLRLIRKTKRREARKAAEAASRGEPAGAPSEG
jgi:lipid-A-disaccharide synthase-like uncharacterized protein